MTRIYEANLIMKKIVIQSISSDIGYSLALHWLGIGHTVSGTYRTNSPNIEALKAKGVKLFQCDLQNQSAIDACAKWVNDMGRWDIFVIGAGNQVPVGDFEKINFDEWESSIYQNFTGQLRLIHGVLASRNSIGNSLPTVLMFAGGGTNNATKKYSAYTVSKIACIKMCELLQAEIEDCIFSIIGPGWVKTKIHDATLDAKEMAGENYLKTKEMLAGDLCNPMERVISCCDWLVGSKKALVGGRNFSVVHDPWDSLLIEKILEDDNSFKLRRSGNDLFRKEKNE
jgi:NAD(P)-dependent dehydrogenase (short-subunit alcohol dehydrogenase family)